jgi:F0F1-type ATP synthase alpha subunit
MKMTRIANVLLRAAVEHEIFPGDGFYRLTRLRLRPTRCTV